MSQSDTKKEESKALTYRQQFSSTKDMNDKLLKAAKDCSLNVPDILRQATAKWLKENGY